MSDILKIYDPQTQTWVTIPAIKGDTGPAGPGLPSGGTTGQIIKKRSATNYDTEWADAPFAENSTQAEIESAIDACF